MKTSRACLAFVHCIKETPATPRCVCVCVRVCMFDLGEDEAVIVGVTGVFRSVLHGIKEQHRHNLGHAAT